jgi:cation transport ATPase
MPGGQRGALGQLVRLLSLATLATVYVGSMIVTYRQLQANTEIGEFIGAPDWTRAVLIMGLVVGGGLGTAAAVVDDRSETSSWVLTLVGVGAALAWSLWATERAGEPAVNLMFAAAAPVIGLLVWAELMRQLRNRN